MTPIPPSSILFLLQAGWPAELVMPFAVEAINGIRAQRSVGMRLREGEADFNRVVELFGLLQRSGATAMRVIEGTDAQDATLFVLRRGNLTAEVRAARDELAGLLGVSSDASELRISFGELSENDTELALLTRSTLAIMLELAGQVSVPESHAAEGRTLPSLFTGEQADVDARRLMNIYSSTAEPEDAFVSVRYRDHWFWVDDRDYRSKRSFAFLMLLFSLTESGGNEGLPLVTIPAG
jgi:hypothetical protein